MVVEKRAVMVDRFVEKFGTANPTFAQLRGWLRLLRLDGVFWERNPREHLVRRRMHDIFLAHRGLAELGYKGV